MSDGDRQANATESTAYGWYVVVVLMLANTIAFVDRHILSLLIEPIRRDLGLSDTQIGLLAGFAFAIFYTILGVPIARLADVRSRRAIIATGIFLWSLMTAVSGLARNYLQLFLARIGVGVGEAALGPAAYSIIADYFPPEKLARAIGLYAMGLYAGAGLAMIGGSAVVSLTSGAGPIDLPLIGTVKPWQLAFFIVSLPGLIVVALMATVREPRRREFLADGTVREAAKEAVPIRDVIAFMLQHGRLMLSIICGFGFIGTVITAFLVWTPEMLRRSYGWDIVTAGMVYGGFLVVLAGSAPYAGGWLASWFRRRDRLDAEIRVAMYAGIAITPLSVVAMIAPGPWLGLPFLALLTFFLAFAQGLPPTIIQIVAPNNMRAQVTAIFMLLAVLSGYTIGPAAVAMLNDYVFQDELALRFSLAWVGGILSPLGVICLWYGLRDYAAVQETGQHHGG